MNDHPNSHDSDHLEVLERVMLALIDSRRDMLILVCLNGILFLASLAVALS